MSCAQATTTQELPPKEQYGPDADGIRTTVEYRYDDDGNVEKVTRRIKVVEEAGRVKKAIAQRREWKKFGAAFGIPHGTLEPGVIGLMDERHITVRICVKVAMRRSCYVADIW